MSIHNLMDWIGCALLLFYVARDFFGTAKKCMSEDPK